MTGHFCLLSTLWTKFAHLSSKRWSFVYGEFKMWKREGLLEQLLDCCKIEFRALENYKSGIQTLPGRGIMDQGVSCFYGIDNSSNKNQLSTNLCPGVTELKVCRPDYFIMSRAWWTQRWEIRMMSPKEILKWGERLPKTYPHTFVWLLLTTVCAPRDLTNTLPPWCGIKM